MPRFLALYTGDPVTKTTSTPPDADTIARGQRAWGEWMAKHAGQAARAERSAVCRGMCKVWRGEAARRRALVEKEAAVFGRGAWAWAAGGRGGERPGRRGVQAACGVGAGRAGHLVARRLLSFLWAADSKTRDK